MANYYFENLGVTLLGESDETGFTAENGDWTDRPASGDAILVTRVGKSSCNKTINAGSYKLQWRRTNGDNTFYDVSASSEIAWGTSTTLVDGASCTNRTSTGICASLGTGIENEGDNSISHGGVAANIDVEFHWAINLDNAVGGGIYDFQIVCTTDSTTLAGTSGSTITIEVEGVDYVKKISEAIETIESAVKKGALKRFITETSELVEAVSTALSTMITKIISESVSLVESVFKKLTYVRIIAEVAALIESASRHMTMRRFAVETAGITESAPRKMTMKRFLFEMSGIAERAIGRRSMSRFITETETLIESIGQSISAQIIKIISEGVALIESSATYVSRQIKQIISETVKMIEVVVKKASLKRLIFDSLSVLDVAHRAMSMKRRLSEVVSLISSVNYSGIAAIVALTKKISESIALIESVSRSITIRRFVSEVIDVVENMRFPRVMFRTLRDVVELISDVARARTMSRALDEAVAIVESTFRRRVFFKIISESISIIEAVSHSAGAVVVIIIDAARRIFTMDTLRRTFKLDTYRRIFTKSDDRKEL